MDAVTTVFTRPMILLPLHQLLDIATHKICYSSSLSVCQALSLHIPSVYMEYLPLGMTWTSDGIMSFNCPRHAAVGIGKKDSFALPLCSPCRGMYTLERAFLEVDLWVKKEGDGSADKHILSTYAEIEVRAQVDDMFVGRIPRDDCNLDLGFKILTESAEAIIQVYAKVDQPHHVRFTALTTAYDDHEIVLFDDKLFGTEKLLQHIVAVKKNANLDVLLRVDESQFQWTFQDELVGTIASPGDSIFEYDQFFVRVFFAPKNSK